MNHLSTHRICWVFFQLPFWNYLGIKNLTAKFKIKKWDLLAHCYGLACHSMKHSNPLLLFYYCFLLSTELANVSYMFEKENRTSICYSRVLRKAKIKQIKVDSQMGKNTQLLNRNSISIIFWIWWSGDFTQKVNTLVKEFKRYLPQHPRPILSEICISKNETEKQLM